METKALKEKHNIDLKCSRTTYSCFYDGDCKSEYFANFGFNFVGDRAYIIQPKDYLIQTKNKNGQNICQIGVYGNRVNKFEYILGDIFMQNFYVILDYENSQFALNGVYTRVNEIKEKGYRDPDLFDDEGIKKPESSSIIWAVIGSIIGVLAIVAIVGFIVVRMRNRKLQSNLSKYEQL